MAQAAEATKEAAPAMSHEPANGVKCFGVNTCKGTGTCAVTKEQIKVANQVFKNKFNKATPHECGGANGCGAKSGYLEWVKKADRAECFKSGGFVFETKKDPKTKKDVVTVLKG